jgi:peroxiredoxin
MKVLEQIARDSQAGYEKIRTWSGKGTYIESSVWDTGKQAGSRVERRAELQFVLDNQANALRVEWEETEPVRLFSADAERGRLLTKNLNRFQSILTADNWFDFRTSRRFSTDEPPIFPYDSSTASRVLMIRAPGEADGARHETEGMIDPRVWASIIGRHVHGLRRFFWEEHDWLKENDEKKRRDGKPATAFLQSEVVRRKTDVGTVILVRRYWKSKEGPLDKSHPHTLRREITFEERHGYAMTRCEFASGGRISESSEISFERNREIAVPVRFIRTVFNTGAGHRAATMEVRLTESQINESVDAGRFARDSLPLQDGERIHDTRRDQGFVIENGEPIAVEKNPKSRMGWEPQASTSLWQHAIMGREWNDLVRESVELNNRGIKSTAEELPDLERSEAYRLNREAWEALAHRYIALHLRQDPVHQDRLDGLNCLGQVIRMEFAGPASEEASGILLRENALTGDQQWFAMLLAYSMPASLSAETVLRGMLAQSESRATQAQARMSLARFLVEQAERKRMVEALPGRDRQVVDKYGDWYLNRIRQVDPDAAEREAEKLWREVIEKYADVEGLTNEKVKLAVQAQRDLLRLQHAMGRKAPEIIGHDIDGNALKLSDTNGKVRVLMFWGHWCSPCRGHYAHLRELATKHAGAPFAVLGVCSDKEKSTIRKAIDSGDVTWRFWWDGDDDRWRIHKEWGLAGAPWFFVLDRDGVIRFAGIRGAELDAAIELLLR